jgi:hypothetical protein
MLNYFRGRKFAAPDVSTQERLERLEAYAAANLLESRKANANGFLHAALLLALIAVLLYFVLKRRPACPLDY